MRNSICVLFGGARCPLCSFWLSVQQEVSMRTGGGCKCLVEMSVAMNQSIVIEGRERAAVTRRDQSQGQMTRSQDASKNIPS